MSNSDLTLYNIESELAQLVSLREEMAESGEDTAAVDQQIAEYAAREITKVDGIRAYLRHCDFMEDGAKAEAHRLQELASLWAARKARLGAIVLRVMQDNGLTRLEGRTGTLAVRANPPKVEVQEDLDLLPVEYVRVVPETRQPDKKAIAAAVKAGEAVPGARLVTRERLEIR